jgi:hypothetical protein
LYALLGLVAHFAGVPWTLLVSVLFLAPHKAPKQSEDYLYSLVPSLRPPARPARRRASEKPGASREAAGGSAAAAAEAEGDADGEEDGALREDLSGVWKRAKLVNYEQLLAAQVRAPSRCRRPRLTLFATTSSHPLRDDRRRAAAKHRGWATCSASWPPPSP